MQTVLFISDQCNLKCKHCAVYAKEKPNIMTYEEIRKELEYSYRLGSRFVDLEGGEVMLWKDGDYRINDVIDLAKEQIMGTGGTISQIAYSLGFQYPQHLSRMFKKKVGCTPNEYRVRIQKA